MADKPGRVEPGRTVFIGNIPYGKPYLQFSGMKTDSLLS